MAEFFEAPWTGYCRFPERLSREQFLTLAYPRMFLARRLEERLLDLFHKGYVKGTVTLGIGNEATAVGMTMPLRPGQDITGLLHRDFAAHLLLGCSPWKILCQYLANAESPTHGREGNVHHGHAGTRRLPMISHLGKMLSPVVGATWVARRRGEQVFGLGIIGDGGTSTGEFHEALNMAAVHDVPVLFLIENNEYAFSTPTNDQYRCRRLTDRAVGYGIDGHTVDGTDPWAVYCKVCDLFETMQDSLRPVLLECQTLRLLGHAAYDKGDYVDPEQRRRWQQRDPLPTTRRRLAEECAVVESEIVALEEQIEEQIEQAVAETISVARPKPRPASSTVYARSEPPQLKPFQTARAKCGDAVRLALDYLLTNHEEAFLAGLDVGTYGSAFKTCKGLIDQHGRQRVIDMPLAESSIVGFALGASQAGMRPIVEFQFADFGTEAVTQLGLNAGTWFFRADRPAPLLMRLPCGGGLTMGAFHCGEYEGLWSRFPGLKILYPATPQETFEALVAGFHDNNPCLVLEHKLLYWSQSGSIAFDGQLDRVWQSRQYTEGDRLTLVAFGAMVHEALAAAAEFGDAVEVINPFVLQPLAIGPILQSVAKSGRLLVVQESGRTQGLGDTIISQVAQRRGTSLRCPPVLVASPDAPVPFAPELESQHRPDRQKIAAAIERLLRKT